MQTLNEVIFDPHTKPSQFRSLHCYEVNFDPPHRNEVYHDYLHNNNGNFDVSTKTMSFLAGVILCYVHKGIYSCDTTAIDIT